MSMSLIYSIQMAPKQTSSLSEIVYKYGGQLMQFIKGKVNKKEDAEDILQEVWYQTSKLANLNELENLSAWLYTVTRNKITDLYRKKKNDSLEDYTFEDDEGVLNIKEILLIDATHRPELKMFKDIFWNELMKALDELPENQRSVFIRNELDDLTLQEIADNDNENVKTIISRKGYAVKHLRKRLQNLYNEFKE